jgi:hypothetical protein
MTLKHVLLYVVIAFACIYAANKITFVSNIVG